jgi:hypothetical protein
MTKEPEAWASSLTDGQRQELIAAHAAGRHLTAEQVQLVNATGGRYVQSPAGYPELAGDYLTALREIDAPSE